ncbi:MAG: phosphoenolpyruvate--protein phosphotransferase [Planctomycetaceae bacterium]
MVVKRGVAVSPGVAIGPALLFGEENFKLARHYTSRSAIETEVARFHTALDAVCTDIEENQRVATERLGKEYGAIFGAHLMMARAPELISEVERLIREVTNTPERACEIVLNSYAKLFQELGSRYHAERAHDIYDLKNRLLRQLLGKQRQEMSDLTEPVVILAHNLTPSETANLQREFVLGFATEVGGPTSHTAILAGALELPAVVGVGDFLSEVTSGDIVIIDGDRGEIIINPVESVIAERQEAQKKQASNYAALETERAAESITADGETIQLLGNIEFPTEAEHCLERGADGIGLYRTEFLYLGAEQEPSEEDQYRAYCQVIEALGGREVVIRTLDVGADKIPNIGGQPSESPNPALGLRGIRLSLRYFEGFKTQLRAILRAAAKAPSGSVKIMFPLISSLQEFRQAKMLVRDVMNDLDEAGESFPRDVPLGMMVEVPSAAILADQFAAEVDFFSIGTNDLIQYTLAVDRGDPAVSNQYRTGDPAILRLIRMVVDAADKPDRKIPVTVCGQMSSDPKFLPLLLGLGIRRISVTPHSIPELKAVIRRLTIPKAKDIATHAEWLGLSHGIDNYLQGELTKICPQLVR